jgi:hypothetical protein
MKASRNELKPIPEKQMPEWARVGSHHQDHRGRAQMRKYAAETAIDEAFAVEQSYDTRLLA